MFWAIPAVVYAFVIGVVGLVCWFLAFFAVLFTGRWPHGLRALVMKQLRVSIRTNAYTPMLTDGYPPFVTDSPEAVAAIRRREDAAGGGAW